MCIKVVKIAQNTFEMINWGIVEEEIEILYSNRFFIQLCELRRENDESQEQKEKRSNLGTYLHHFLFRWMLVHLCEC